MPSPARDQAASPTATGTAGCSNDGAINSVQFTSNGTLVAGGLDSVVRFWDVPAGDFTATNPFVATTPAGATDDLAARLPADVATLFDVLYHPWPTPLAAAWRARGGTVLGGLDLLVHQAVLQVELMTCRVPGPLAAMRAAGERALSER